MAIGDLLLVVGSLLLATQAAFTTVIMLYAWEDQERHKQSRVPTTYELPQSRFTLLLPARNEEAVIQDTIQRVADLNYPSDLVEVLVVIEAGDAGTISKVEEKLASLQLQGVNHVRLLTFTDPPINKPHGLNVGLYHATGDVVGIFDAEDEPHPDILHIVNTVMIRDEAPVVQCGVQLMNYSDNWFSALNVLEYFFWFRSRMHYHSSVGMVPLGGNTVFLNRQLCREMEGWDENCLTEDADLGIRLSAAGVPIRVLSDDRYVTREETPPTIEELLRQRTRWNQGFMQVLLKGDWLRLPGWPQRLLALYTFGFPVFQALMIIYLPVSLWMTFSVRVPAGVAMVSFLPLYMLFTQLVVTLIGLYEFTAAHSFRPAWPSALKIFIGYLPYQWLLSYAALRAVWRLIRGVKTWEKTTHVGAHRVGRIGAVTTPSILVDSEDAGHD